MGNQMRLSGLISGMDTDSLVEQLVRAKRVKVDKAVKSQLSVQYKQEAWKDLNAKIKNFQNKYVSNMRFKDAYIKKTTKVSDPSAVSVITGEGAMDGVQTLRVEQLAKTSFFTGARMNNSGNLTALSSMEDLGITDEASFTISNRTGSKTITINAETTISDVLNELKDFGVNASFDAGQQRFFISAKESGFDYDINISAEGGGNLDALTKLGLNTDSSLDEEKRATKTAGQDAIVYLNDAKFTSNTNVFAINGLTFTALNETGDKKVTVTTQDDTDGIYDMIRDFIKDYSDLINEMDKLYNADAAKGYEPLTDEEKDAMSDSEVEKWEKKVKDAILRRDDNVNSVASALKEVMRSGIEVNGKTMYLTDFGIEPMSYFECPDNEKNALHIDGDDKDPNTSGKTDKLKSMIASDYNTVVNFFSELNKELMSKMDKMSASVEGYRGYGYFYDNKRLETDYNDYKSKIADLEKKLSDYEDKWYAKFAKMEKAMAQMQSNTSAVTALLGGGS